MLELNLGPEFVEKRGGVEHREEKREIDYKYKNLI